MGNKASSSSSHKEAIVISDDEEEPELAWGARDAVPGSARSTAVEASATDHEESVLVRIADHEESVLVRIADQSAWVQKRTPPEPRLSSDEEESVLVRIARALPKLGKRKRGKTAQNVVGTPAPRRPLKRARRTRSPTLQERPLLRQRRCVLRNPVTYAEEEGRDVSDLSDSEDSEDSDDEDFVPDDDYALPCSVDEFPEWITDKSPGGTLDDDDIAVIMNMPRRKLRQVYYLLETDERGKRDGDALEKLAARVFRRLGYHVQNTGAHVSQTCGDGGRDLVMRKHGLHYVVSCKNHKSRIGVAEVNRIVGVALHDKADVAIGLAAGWSKQALKHAKEMRDNQHVKVELYDYKWLVKELARL